MSHGDFLLLLIMSVYTPLFSKDNIINVGITIQMKDSRDFKLSLIKKSKEKGLFMYDFL
jgi:hypothetical protein